MDNLAVRFLDCLLWQVSQRFVFGLAKPAENFQLPKSMVDPSECLLWLVFQRFGDEERVKWRRTSPTAGICRKTVASTELHKIQRQTKIQTSRLQQATKGHNIIDVKDEKGQDEMKEKTNFGNFPPLLLLLLHKCRLNRGQLHFARKTHFEWQTPKIYQCFDEDHTPGWDDDDDHAHARGSDGKEVAYHNSP